MTSQYKTKSPILVYPNFISPKICNKILNDIKVPKIEKRIYDTEQTAFGKMQRFHDASEAIIAAKMQTIEKEISDYYSLTLKHTEKMLFQYYPEGITGPAEEPGCQSSTFVRKKWVKIKDRDLTAVLWLKDYNDEMPLDMETEVYGGKLEFPQYNFSLNPQVGTLIIYPASPHFITAISEVMAGDLYQVRINMAAEEGWLYQPEKFGSENQDWNYKTWFKDM